MRGWRGWLYATMVAILIFSGFYWYHQRHLETASSVTWYSPNPITFPKNATSLPMGAGGTTTTQNISMLAGSVAGAEWYLPVTAKSAVSYALHDGQGRWVISGRHYSLTNAPTDPVGALSTAPNGSGIAWVLHDQIRWLKADGAITLIPHGHSVHLTDRGIEYVVSAGTTHQVINPYGTRFVQYNTATSPTPFLNHGTTFVYDDRGTIYLMTLSTGKTHRLFSVKAVHWSSVQSSVSFSGGIAIVLSRQTPIPAYLLTVVTPQRTYWYRWSASTTPEIGVSSQGQLVVAGIEPHLVVYSGGSLHTLPQSAGIFSAGPMGIVLPNSHGGFQRLVKINP